MYVTEIQKSIQLWWTTELANFSRPDERKVSKASAYVFCQTYGKTSCNHYVKHVIHVVQRWLRCSFVCSRC